MTTMRKVAKCVVPEELMIPIGAQATQELKKCADSWSDSEIALLRSKLPQQYHAVPTDHLRQWWINIRKKGTPGYKLNGHGAAVGSRKKAKREKPPQWYLDYINSEDWKRRREEWLEFWGHRCATCNVSQQDAILDVHHRTYVNLRHEKLTDCLVLCRRCHDAFESEVEIDERRLF